MTKEQAVELMLNELQRAVAKFPNWPDDIIHAAAVVAEEAGELTKASLQHVYEPDRSTREDVVKEAVQTGAMAIRFLLSSNLYEAVLSEQHHQQ